MERIIQMIADIESAIALIKVKEPGTAITMLNIVLVMLQTELEKEKK